MRPSIFAASIFLCSAAVSAAKADEPYWGSTPNSNWGGFYIGGSAGGIVDGNAHWDYTGFFPPIPQFDDDISGGLYGGYVGYNHQIGRFVIGIEGDLARGDINGSESCENDAGYQCNTDIGNVFTVRGRLGYAFDHLLVYGTAGWARADVSLSAPQTGGNISFNAKDEVDGYVVGGGAEMKIAHNVSLGAEALYFNFDDTVAPWVATNCCGVPPGPNIGQQNFEADFTVVRGRLTLHLN